MPHDTVICTDQPLFESTNHATEMQNPQIVNDIHLLSTWYQNRMCDDVTKLKAAKDIDAAQTRLIHEYQGLIKSLAYKFSPNSPEITRYDFHDLLQEAKLYGASSIWLSTNFLTART